VSPTRLVAFVVAAVFTAVLAVQFARAVQPAVLRERQSRLNQACIPLDPTSSNRALGRFPREAPDFVAQDYTGQSVALSAYRGKVVLLNFWASWCPPCREEMPSMDRLAQALGHQGLVVLAVSSDDGWQQIRDFFPNGTAMTILWDPAAAGGEATEVGGISRSCRTDKLPESYLIDRNGNIRYYVVNTRDWSTPSAQQCLRALLEE
jgi:peroxiredoxin